MQKATTSNKKSAYFIFFFISGVLINFKVLSKNELGLFQSNSTPSVRASKFSGKIKGGTFSFGSIASSYDTSTSYFSNIFSILSGDA